MAKFRQLNVDGPYFRPIKTNTVYMYIVNHQYCDNGCGGERSDNFAFSINKHDGDFKMCRIVMMDDFFQIQVQPPSSDRNAGTNRTLVRYKHPVVSDGLLF